MRLRLLVVLVSVGSSTFQYSRRSVPFSRKYATRCNPGRCSPTGFAQPPRVRATIGCVPGTEPCRAGCAGSSPMAWRTGRGASCTKSCSSTRTVVCSSSRCACCCLSESRLVTAWLMAPYPMANMIAAMNSATRSSSSVKPRALTSNPMDFERRAVARCPVRGCPARGSRAIRRESACPSRAGNRSASRPHRPKYHSPW